MACILRKMNLRKTILILLPLIFLNIYLFRVYRTSISKIIFPVVSEVFQAKPSQDKSTTIILGGDVMLGRSVMTKSFALNNYAYPFLKIGSFLKSANLVFVNLEAPFFTPCPKKYSGMVFCTDPKMVQGLVDAGVDVVTLENNHILNYGQEGLRQTKVVLSQNQINWVGFGEMTIKTINGTKFGFLGFDFLSKKPTEKDYEIIKKGKSLVDVLIVGIHWGGEYQAKAGSYQREIAKKVVAAGADVIAGHHPHWVQDVEYILGKPVFYSLGNLVFDQMWSENTKKGLLVTLTYEGSKLVKENQTRVYISEIGQPQLVGSK